MDSKTWRPGLVDTATQGGWVLVYCRQQFLADSNGLLFPRQWLKRQDLPMLSEQGIGYLDKDPVYVLTLNQAVDMSGCHWQGLRAFMLQGDLQTFQMLGYASQIGTWAEQHRFCGSCAQPLQAMPGERAMLCGSCNVPHYPRLSPSMIVLVTKGEELLLARSPQFPEGLYSTLAGFVEPGESVEQCVLREVREEVGLDVGKLQYMGSQGWPFPHSLMLGFHAEYIGGEIVPQVGEIEDARWFHPEQLPLLPPGRSISRYLIDLYLARRSGLPEPVLPN